VGGEGRNVAAWNLNPSRFRTFGPQRGEPIPRLILGRGEAIPLADGSVDVVIVERTPLRPVTLGEILRVCRPTATIVLRHVVTPGGDPHRVALDLLLGDVTRGWIKIGSHTLRETVIRRREVSCGEHS
jgi:hypothetical protein